MDKKVIGIIGGTASGKTSLVNLIPRFYDVTEGRVKINGIVNEISSLAVPFFIYPTSTF